VLVVSKKNAGGFYRQPLMPRGTLNFQINVQVIHLKKKGKSRKKRLTY
jgi:hypothetical protein